MRRAGRGREVHPECWEWSGVPPGRLVGPVGELGVVGRLSQRARRGLKAHSECQVRLGGSPRGPGRAVMDRESLPVCWETITEGQEALPEGWEGLGDHPGGTGLVGRPSWWARRGREALM